MVLDQLNIFFNWTLHKFPHSKIHIHSQTDLLIYSINSLLKIYYVYVTDLVVANLKESYNLVGSGMTQWIKWI